MVSFTLVKIIILLVAIIAMCIFPAVYSPPPGSNWPNAFEIIGILVFIFMCYYLLTTFIGCLRKYSCSPVGIVEGVRRKWFETKDPFSLPNYVEFENEESGGGPSSENNLRNPENEDLTAAASSSLTPQPGGNMATDQRSQNQGPGNFNNPRSSDKTLYSAAKQSASSPAL